MAEERKKDEKKERMHGCKLKKKNRVMDGRRREEGVNEGRNNGWN